MTAPQAASNGVPATPGASPAKKNEPWWPVPVAPLRPAVAHDYGVSLFWSLVDQIGGTVKTITLRDELVRCIREGAFAEAYLLALQHDYQLGHSHEFPLPPPGKSRDQIALANRTPTVSGAKPAAAAPSSPDASWRASQD